MKIIEGNILSAELLDKANAVCITTNGVTKSNGYAVMGAGLALAAAKKWPVMPANLGLMLERKGNHVHEAVYVVGPQGVKLTVVSFPTKWHWRQQADLSLIVSSAQELRDLSTKRGWTNVLLPWPGCGMGGLKRSVVQPVISKLLDDRFTIVQYDGI